MQLRIAFIVLAFFWSSSNPLLAQTEGEQISVPDLRILELCQDDPNIRLKSKCWDLAGFATDFSGELDSEGTAFFKRHAEEICKTDQGCLIQRAASIGATNIFDQIDFSAEELEAQDPEFNYYRPLVIAIGTNNAAFAELLLKKGANPNALSTEKAPLNWALGSEELLQLLLDFHADPNRGPMPAIVEAARKNDLESMALILDHEGTDPNVAAKNQETALYMNAYYLDPSDDRGFQIFKSLIEKGANINKPSRGGLKPIQILIDLGFTRHLEYLKEVGISVVWEDYSYSGLFEAIKSGNLAEATKHINAKNLRATDYLGRSAAVLAIQYEQSQILRRLIDSGADLYPENTIHTYNLLHLASEHDVKIFTMLLEAGFELDKAWARGDWILHVLARDDGKLEHFKILAHMRDPLDLDRQDQSGYTALTISLMRREVKTAQWLLEAGTDPNLKAPDERLPTNVQYALDLQNLELLELILEKGGNPHQIGTDGIDAWEFLKEVRTFERPNENSFKKQALEVLNQYKN